MKKRTSSVIVGGKVNKGSVPPPFTLKDQDGRNVSLSKFKGKPVVLYFYPADETPGCTKQACAFRDSYEKFKKAGAQVVGISGDDAESHKAFAKKYRLPFTLLSDEGNKVRKEWGVPSDLFGTLPGRQTYVLDKNGVVQLIYNNQFQPEKHIDETLKLLQAL
ncbi:peroxiredoxin [Nitriliruptoraceae bacterium ZYF776]|nr:peroxiredoxin [Profundirhabdus halotolerans]